MHTEEKTSGLQDNCFLNVSAFSVIGSSFGSSQSACCSTITRLQHQHQSTSQPNERRSKQYDRSGASWHVIILARVLRARTPSSTSRRLYVCTLNNCTQASTQEYLQPHVPIKQYYEELDNSSHTCFKGKQNCKGTHP